MADENKPAFYPRVGRNIAKNFRSAQPPAFIEDPRAMDLPQYGDVDLSAPSKENLELSRRMAERDAQLRRQKSADTSPLEKLAGGVQAGRFLGSALTQAINSAPTRLFKGDEAADKFMQERMYKPEQPLAYEYAGDVGNFLEKLETEYKIPPVLPEAVALQFLTAPATSQAARAAGRGAEKSGMALERSMEPVVKGALERGGLPREMAMAMGANTQSNVIKPKGGNWFGRTVEDELEGLKRNTAGGNDPADILRQMHERYPPEEIEKLHEGARRGIADNFVQLERDVALNNWVDRNLTNYVKKEMATPEDPVRKLAEEGIVSFPVAEDPRYWNRFGESAREQYGGTQMAQSDLAKQWENRTDPTIRIDPAKRYQELGDLYPEWIKKLDPETSMYQAQGVGGRMNPADLGFDHILDVLRQDVAEGRIRPDQLNKVSMEQAVRRTYEYDQEMLKKMRETALKNQEGFPLYKEYPEGYKWIELALPKDNSKRLSEIDTILNANRQGGEYGVDWLRGANGEKEYFVTKGSGRNTVYMDKFPTEAEAIARGKELSGQQIDVDALRSEREGLTKEAREKMLEDALKYEGDTMGHCVGGYCPDVIEGKSRIFSLRDAKGEPHVTVEVQPNQYAPRWDDVKPYLDAARKEAIKLPNGYTSTDIADIAVRMAKENAPQNIVQIKGKGNAKPKEDYLPFVQDFVRGGKWSNVGDLKNTGLEKFGTEFLTSQEAEAKYKPMVSDALNYLETHPSLERLRAARRARNNFKGDTTSPEYRDLERQAGESIAKDVPYTYAELKALLSNPEEWTDHGESIYMPLSTAIQQIEKAKKSLGPLPPAEGMKRGGKVSISNNPDAMMLELNNQKMKNGVPAYAGGKLIVGKGLKAAKPEVMKASEALGKIEGRPLVITQADRTKVGEGYLGGPGFSSLQLTEPEYRAAEAAWGVKTPGVAKMILGGAKKAGESPVFTTMIGSPTQHQSNQMVFDKLYNDFKKSAKKGNLDPELRDKINLRLASAVDKEGNPVFPLDVDILDKKFRDIANTFDRRSIAGHLMGGVQVGGKKGQIIDYDKIIRDTTDPALIDVPSGALGNRLFTLSGGIIDRPDLHPAFPTILQGEDLGLQFNPVAKDILMRDFIEKTMREKGRKPGYMDFTRGYPPSQLITEDILTEMQKLGLKEGGAVKKPAAYIDGSEFWEAAKKYGIRDSMENLNKIVDLVNKGLSVDDAARQVADTGMHKAAGGAITGDDLIIEERPL